MEHNVDTDRKKHTDKELIRQWNTVTFKKNFSRYERYEHSSIG